MDGGRGWGGVTDSDEIGLDLSYGIEI
ncbi:hypothetical protein A2U01_0064341, partial [Trifolium medium]|nr:hypothetical protein [Trifolium medium]